jgi:hypothetical protein
MSCLVSRKEDASRLSSVHDTGEELQGEVESTSVNVALR